MTLWQRVVEANRPGPPEPSRLLRAASVAAVLVAAGACHHEGELGTAATAFTAAATVVGNLVSYRRRENPWPATKPILAVCAVAGFVWFIATATRTATPGDVSTVLGPLAVLFAWVLGTHAFDVPARRDVAYTLAGSAALMAVAAAQAVDLSFGAWVLAWTLCVVVGLVAMWQSAASARGVPWAHLGSAVAGLALVAVLLLSLLPAPRPSTSLLFPSAGGGDPVSSQSRLTDGPASLPARAASARGRTGVGGYLGFARSLDLAARAGLGSQVVLRVRASRPGYWIGQTYDHWDGRGWTQSADPADGRGVLRLESGPPFTIPLTADQTAAAASGRPDVETFYLAESGPNLVFHTDQAQRVYVRSKALYLTGDGTIVSSEAMGAGTIYTVVSNDTAATPAELRRSTEPGPAGSAPATALGAAEARRYLQLPRPDPAVSALAHRITAGVETTPGGDPRTYDKVEAIEAWMSVHVHYTTDIPPLPAGADAVDHFLFADRRGYCEQISTATVVMLRALGIPARETVGYVPGPYDPFTDLYEVQARDAHAWVQVWFPGYGWQNFDPTARVPLANPSSGTVLGRGAVRLLGSLPPVPAAVAGGLAAVGAVAAVAVRRRRRRPRSWTLRVALDIARGGRRRGVPRRPAEPLGDYGARLGQVAPLWAEALARTCRVVERAAYGGIEPSAEELADAVGVARRFARRPAPGRGRGGRAGDGGLLDGDVGGGGDGGGDGRSGPARPGAPAGAPGAGQARERASASANAAPAASSGR